MRIKSLLITAVLATAILFSAQGVGAVTIQDLMNQIAQLQAQLKALQAQQGTTTTAWCHTFNANIGMGQKTGNKEVNALVIALQKEGILKQEEIFSEGYDEFLASAVTEFQEKYASEILTPYRLKRGTGYVGVGTRKKLNALYGCKETPVSPINPPNTTTAPTNLIPEFELTPAPETTQPTIQPTTQSSITVLSPNGDESLTVGQIYNIKWTSIGLENSKVNIYIYGEKAGSSASVVSNILASKEIYSWTPKLYDQVVFGSGFKIYIGFVGSASISPFGDYSDNYFNILPTATPVCTDSDEGLNYDVNGQTTVKNNGVVIVGKNFTDYCTSENTLMEGYCINNKTDFITEEHTCDYGCENGMCKQAPIPTITISSPNGGESWTQGSAQMITWYASNLSYSDVMAIRLRDEAGAEYELSLKADNYYKQFFFTLPSLIPVGRYKAEVKTIENGKYYLDTSDEYFNIIAPSSTLNNSEDTLASIAEAINKILQGVQEFLKK